MSQLLSQFFQFFSNWLAPQPGPQPSPPPVPVTPPTPAPTPTPVPVSPSPESAVVAAINAARVGQGLSALVEDESLDRLASSWAASMATSGVREHGDFAGRIGSVYPNTAAAENIAEGQPDANSLVAAWMNDPPHRANILGDYNRLGVGSDADGSGSIYWCADFVQVV
jgi:uncharacterized protein YkwD